LYGVVAGEKAGVELTDKLTWRPRSETGQNIIRTTGEVADYIGLQGLPGLPEARMLGELAAPSVPVFKEIGSTPLWETSGSSFKNPQFQVGAVRWPFGNEVPNRMPQPGDADFMGPTRLSLAGDADFVGPAKPSEISPQDYSALRRQTPTQNIRDIVNSGPEAKVDPVYGYPVNRLEADHIVPMKVITQMPNFDMLSPAGQVDLLNNPENFMGLGKSTNTSKGALMWSEWPGHSRLGPVPPEFQQQMIDRQSALKAILQEQINNGVRNGK
jgi:hypothetical protein